jgi:hypothetical protein
VICCAMEDVAGIANAANGTTKAAQVRSKTAFFTD